MTDFEEFILTGPGDIERLEWRYPDGRVRVCHRSNPRDSWSAPEWWQITRLED